MKPSIFKINKKSNLIFFALLYLLASGLTLYAYDIYFRQRLPRRCQGQNQLRVCIFLLFSFILLGLSFCGKNNITQKIKKDEKITDFVAVTITANLNMRIQPHQYTARILLLSEEMVLDVIGKTQNPVKVGRNTEYWYHLRAENGITGWVFGEYLELVKRENRDRALEIAKKNIRKEKLNVISKLSGYWYQVFNDGEEGKHRLIIFRDQSYLSFNSKIKEVYVGEIDVDLQKGKLIFKAAATFGYRINFYFNNKKKDFSLTLSQYGRHSRFKRSTEKPPSLKELESKGFKILEH